MFIALAPVHLCFSISNQMFSQSNGILRRECLWVVKKGYSKLDYARLVTNFALKRVAQECSSLVVESLKVKMVLSKIYRNIVLNNIEKTFFLKI